MYILLSNLPPCTGKNVLGTNVTNRLLPVAAQLTHGLGLLGAGFNTIGGVIRCGDIYNIKHYIYNIYHNIFTISHYIYTRGDSKEASQQARQVGTFSGGLRRQQAAPSQAPTCTTGKGGSGRCQDIQV